MNTGTTSNNFSQGDIVLIPFPFSNLTGSDQRPAIIISSKTVNDSTSDVILAQITSNTRNDQFSFPLKDEDLDTPLPKNSEIRCHKLFTAEKSIIKKRISGLKKGKLSPILRKISSFIS
jgi:mRNA interferase MazF